MDCDVLCICQKSPVYPVSRWLRRGILQAEVDRLLTKRLGSVVEGRARDVANASTVAIQEAGLLSAVPHCMSKEY